MGMPGAPDVSRVPAGTYKVDPNHTQVIWTVDHLGFSSLSGLFGATGGSLTIDPAKPNAAKVDVTFDTSVITVTSVGFAKHLATPEMFDTAKFPTATFTSTSVVVNGTSAKIMGNLTIKGITKPIVIDAKFVGAGSNPMSKKLNFGFHGSATIKRSEFGLGFAVPAVSDEVKLGIHVAFTAP
nr:YceI family protein [Sphingomonas vulcanisoli]